MTILKTLLLLLLMFAGEGAFVELLVEFMVVGISLHSCGLSSMISDVSTVIMTGSLSLFLKAVTKQLLNWSSL